MSDPAASAWAPGTLLRTGQRFVGTWANRHRSREAILTLQLEKLRRMVAHAYATVPFYRELMDTAGVGPADIRSVADLSQIPVTGRAERQSAPHGDLLSSAVSPRQITEWASSGTTGRPIRVGIDRNFDRVRRAVFLRTLGLCGHRPWHRSAIVLRPGHARRAPRWTRLAYLGSGVDHENFLQTLGAIEPQTLYTSTTWLREVLEVAPPEARLTRPIRRIFTTSETLTPDLRRRIETVLGGRVIDLYGSVELGLAGWECPSGGYHVADDAVVLERVTEGGGPARLVATNLENFGMPFLRYDTGDLAAAPPEAPCRCRLPFSRIGGFEGRSIDAVRRPGGGVLYVHDITDAMEQVSGVARYQVVQEDLHRFRVRLELVETVRPDLEARVRAALGPALWPSARIEVEPAAALAAPGQKLRIVVSRCGAEAGSR